MVSAQIRTVMQRNLFSLVLHHAAAHRQPASKIEPVNKKKEIQYYYTCFQICLFGIEFMGILVVSFFFLSQYRKTYRNFLMQYSKKMYEKKRHARNFKNNQAHRFYLKLNVKFIFAIKKIKVTIYGQKISSELINHN